MCGTVQLLTGEKAAIMAGTRSSARLNSSPASEKTPSGTKRKAEDNDSPSSNKSKRGRPSKDQRTLEETISAADDKNETADTAIADAEAKVAIQPEANGHGKLPVPQLCALLTLRRWRRFKWSQGRRASYERR